MAAAALASRTRLGPDLELLQGQPAPPRARPVSAGPEPGSRLGPALDSRPGDGWCGGWEMGLQPRVRGLEGQAAQRSRHPRDMSLKESRRASARG